MTDFQTSKSSKHVSGSAGSALKSVSYVYCKADFQDFQRPSLEVVLQVVDFKGLPDFQNFHP